MASGFGTRLRSANVADAKGLLKYKGKPLINHIVDKIPQDVDILVNTNRKFETNYRRWHQSLSKNVTLCIEPVFTEAQAFGAVSSLDYWIRTENITDDLLVIASDNYFEFDLLKFIATYDGKNVLVAVYDIGDKIKARGFGVVQLDGRKIIGLEEKPIKPKSSLIAIACYLLPPRIFPVLAEYCAGVKRDNLGSFIAYLIDREEVHAYSFKECWFDIGSTDVYYLIKQSGCLVNESEFGSNWCP